MVDEKDIMKQYSYKATSNLVIEQERRRRFAPDSNVAPLKVESLPGRMGDKARPGASDSADKIPSEPSETAKDISESVKLSRADIVDAADELEIDDAEESYIPTTEVSRRAFEALLALVSAKLGDQPRDLLRSAAAETIAVMKDDNQQPEQKRQELSEILGVKLTSEEFSNISLFADRMIDFEANAGGSRSDQGLTVLLDDEDEEATETITAKTVDPDKARLQAELNQMSANVGLDDVLNMDESLPPQVISDVHGDAPPSMDVDTADSMLSRILSTHFSEEEQSNMIPAILDTLSSATDNQTCENKLAALVGFDYLQLVADMMEKRDVIRNARSSSLNADDVPSHKPASTEEALPSAKEGGEPLGTESKANSETSREVRKRPRSRLHRSVNLNGTGISHDVLHTLDIDALAALGHKSRQPIHDSKLPEGSQHIEGKEYEEWYIPPSKPLGDMHKDALVNIDRLPLWARPAFPGTARFNKMQSATYACAFLSDENMLVCAPTGAGKTNVAMLATVRALESFIRKDVSNLESKPSLTVVYIAPMKALVAEVVNNFSKKLGPLGIKVQELTGDVSVSAQEARRSHVVVSTPEKWDIVSRKGGSVSLTSFVGLLIIDEIHLLNDSRGPVLESVVARSRRSLVPNRPKTRILGLSATLPNYRDVASFLAVEESKGLFAFDATYRPCPLQQCFMGISHKKALKRFQLQNSLAYERALHQMQNSEQVIIFVHSRKETISTCKSFVERAIEEEATDRFLKPGTASFEIIQAELSNVSSKDLRGVLEYGLAVHNAGMTRSDRELVEALFEKGHIRVLVSTATLAWGVNLPAHAVIIKGTQVYSPEQGRWTDLSPMDVMQMMGRAGRPQFDTYGEGIIITAKSDVMYYLSVLNNNLPLESRLLLRLTDFLNAEVAAGSVTSIEEGAEWLRFCYLNVRMLKSPHLYGISAEETSMDPTLEGRRKNLVHSAAIKLDRLGLLLYQQETGDLETTTLGRIAADFYVSHTTMSTYVEGLQRSITDVDLFSLVSVSGEFEHVRVREEEKLELARLAERAPIPVKESLDEQSAKTNILLQAYISRLSLDGLALRADMIHISQNATRLTRALVLTAAALKQATSFLKCLNLFKNVATRQWSTQTPLRQFGSGISSDTVRRIERKDVPFERYYDLEVQALQDLAKDKEAGRRLHRLIHCLPRVQLEASARPISRSLLEVNLYVASDFRFDPKLHRREEGFWISVEDGDAERLFYAQLHYVRPFVTKQHSISFVVELPTPQPNHYIVRCVSDSWIAPSTAVPLFLRDLLLPDKFEAFSKVPSKASNSVSKLFNSTVLPEKQETISHQASVEMLANISSYYQSELVKFPPIVNNLFPSLFDSTENVVLATIPSRERGICGELAVARLFCHNPTATAVWVVGRGAIAMNRTFQTLTEGIGKALNLNVMKLESFESSSSLGLQKAGTLIVVGVNHWDQFSRKWRQKKERRVLAKIELMVLDGVHFLSSATDEGAALEAVASRTRYIAATSGSRSPLRIVALSDPIANATSLGQWLGVSPSFVFSYNPTDFAVIPKFQVLTNLTRAMDYEPRSLVRSLQHVLKKSSRQPDHQILVFVPSRDVARQCVEEIRSTEAATTIRGAYIDAEMPSHLRRAVERSFVARECHMLIATPDYAWNTNLVAPLVIIAGTKRMPDNVDTCSTGELDRTDVLQMAFRVTSTGDKKSAQVVVFTEEDTADRYNRILEPEALESRLPERFADHLNAEVASGVVETKQDAVDYLTWTFFYHRLPKNPNYYGLRGLAPDEVSRHLSELVELALQDLEGSKCVAVEGDEDVALGALNLGIIASHYYVRHETVEFFAASVNPRVKLRSILDILSFAWEFRHIEVRQSDINALNEIISKVPFDVDPELQEGRASLSSRHKIHLLIQAHLSRIVLGANLRNEQREIVVTCVRLLRAFVDVIASAGWLKPALVAVELSQMLVQGVWDLDIPLLQLPHMTVDVAKNLKDAYAVSDVFEFLDMEPDDRTNALAGFTNDQLRQVAAACEAYPNLGDIATNTPERQVLPDGTSLTKVTVFVNRNEDSEDPSSNSEVSPADVPLVVAPRYPDSKVEGWWLILGNPSKNILFTLKYFNVRQKASVKLSYAADSTSETESKGESVQLYLVSDSYIDCDQEETITIS